MAIVRWEPRNVMTDFRREFDRFFDNLLYRDSEAEDSWDRAWLPTVDISEDKEGIVIHADIPGINRKDVKVTLHDNVLSLRGERKEEKKEEGRDRHRVERRFGHFQRSFTLPTDVDETRIVADYKDGVLTVKLPKTEKARPKEIEIKAG